jgi:hypothetical protein
MAIIHTNGSFGPSSTVTNTTLNSVADAATFNDPVDGTTLELITTGADSGKLGIKASGVGTTQLATNAVITDKITNGNVTKAKIENVANMKVLGNTSGSSAAPQEVGILDEDDMNSNSDTALATQQSIKAYVDGSSSFGTDGTDYQSTGYQVFPSGLKMAWGDAEVTTLGDTVSFPTGVGFTQPPTVQITYNAGPNNSVYYAPAAGSVSTSSFTVKGSYAAYGKDIRQWRAAYSR